MRYRKLQTLFRDRSIVLGFSIVALVLSVLLFISKASLFQTSAIALLISSVIVMPRVRYLSRAIELSK